MFRSYFTYTLAFVADRITKQFINISNVGPLVTRETDTTVSSQVSVTGSISSRHNDKKNDL